MELSITGEAFYSQGTGGKYKGQQSFGTRLAADATYVSHKTVVVDPRNGITKTSTTQTSVGVSVTKEFPVKPVK